MTRIFARFSTFVAVLAAALALRAAADDLPAPAAPVIPDRVFSAAELGVEPGSSRPVTRALQAAIDHVAEKGGGRLELAPGDYLVGPVVLPGKFELHLAEGVVLRLIERGPDYPVSGGRHQSLFSASGVSDLRISGAGRIDGRGEPWWRDFRAKAFAERRPQLVSFDNCQRVEFSGISTVNPPNTHYALRLCRDVVFRDLVLEAPDESANTDGINISGKNYLIERCRISTGDDNIVILTHSSKTWTPPVCENFVIRDCFLGFGHGLSIGSYTGGGVRGVLAERITFDGTSSGIRMKAARDRGGLVENLVYRDITMRGVKNPVFISSYYPKEPKRPGLDEGSPVTEKTPRWDDILIENLRVTDSENSLILWGVPELPLGRITLRDVSFASKRGAKLYHAPAAVLERVTVAASSGPDYDYWPVPASDATSRAAR